MTTRRFAAALLVACAASCSAAVDHPRALGLDGTTNDPLTVPKGRVHVLVFTSHECPIANSYAPTLRELATSWQHAPVDLYLLHVDPDLDAATARAHATAYELPGTILFDRHQAIARTLGVTTTPEAVVLTTDDVAYRGRIDDQWAALGARRPAAATHDLADAVQRALHGERTPLPHPKAIGCLLPEPR